MSVGKIQLKTIKLEWLDPECLLEVNRCVRYIKQNHGESLKMQDPDVLIKISKLSKARDDAQLEFLYKDLKQKVAACISANPAIRP